MTQFQIVFRRKYANEALLEVDRVCMREYGQLLTPPPQGIRVLHIHTHFSMCGEHREHEEGQRAIGLICMLYVVWGKAKWVS